MTDGAGVPTPAGRPDRSRLLAVARSGQAAMSIGLLAFGAASYVYLAASGRALGPAAFAPVSVLYSVVYLVGSGLYVPFEQELGRSISARRSRGDGSAALVRSAAIVAASTFVVAAVTVAALAPFLADHLFRGRFGFVVVFVVGIGGVGLTFFSRGLLAGSGRYHGFAVLFLADAAVKSVPALVLLVAGIREPLAYGAVLAVSCFVGALLPLTRPTPLGGAGTPAATSALVASLGFLLLTSFFSSLTINVGTIAVEVLAKRSEATEAGVFLSGLVIARIPLFLSQAVQAIVLPRLSEMAASARMDEFRRSVRLLATVLAAGTVVATAGSAAVGPFVVQLMFGDAFDLLGAGDMALLTLASMLGMGALTLNQAQIALHHQRQTWWPWASASVVFVVVTALCGPDLFRRVELGMVAASGVAMLLSGTLLVRELRPQDREGHDIPAL